MGKSSGLTWIYHEQQWHSAKLGSFKPSTHWPPAMRQAFSKRQFLQRFLEEYMDQHSLSSKAAAKALDKERQNRSMDGHFKDLHKMDSSVKHCATK